MRDPTIESISKLLDRSVAELCTGTDSIGASIGIVRDQQLVWCRGYGLSNINTAACPDENTLFRIASVTKTFTAIALFQLRDDGKLSLDDPLTTYIKEFASAKALSRNLTDVTLRRLLCHHSGLICEPPTGNPYWDTLQTPTMEQILQAVHKVEIVVEPDKHFKYSNLAFALLGEVITRVSGQQYEEYVESKILRPLEMNSTFFDSSKGECVPQATGYETNTNTGIPREAPNPHMRGISAAGQLYSTVSDLAKWIALQFRTNAIDQCGTQVLAGHSLVEMHRPVFLEPDWSMGYGLPWISSRLGNQVLVGHTGFLFGYRADISFNTETKLGVIALFNTSALPPVRRKIYQLAFESDASMPTATPMQVPSKPPKHLQDYVGLYNASLGLTMRVDYRNPNLVFSIEVGSSLGFAPGIINETHQADVFKATEGRWIGEEVTFVRSSNSLVEGFELGPFRFHKISDGQ